MSIVFLGIIKQPTTTISRFKISVGQKTYYEDACHWCSAPQVTGYQSEKKKKIFETPICLPIPTQVHNLITMCYKIGETTVQNTVHPQIILYGIKLQIPLCGAKWLTRHVDLNYCADLNFFA